MSKVNFICARSAQNLRDLRDLREKKIVLKIVPADLTELAGPSQIILFFCAKSAGSAGSAGEKILCLKFSRRSHRTRRYFADYFIFLRKICGICEICGRKNIVLKIFQQISQNSQIQHRYLYLCPNGKIHHSFRRCL